MSKAIVVVASLVLLAIATSLFFSLGTATAGPPIVTATPTMSPSPSQQGVEQIDGPVFEGQTDGVAPVLSVEGPPVELQVDGVAKMEVDVGEGGSVELAVDGVAPMEGVVHPPRDELPTDGVRPVD